MPFNHSLLYFFCCSSPSVCLFVGFSIFSPLFAPLPSPVPPYPPFLPCPHWSCVWQSEICMQRSSAPLRACSWMVRTLASCCNPGVASASHDTSSSESADRAGTSSSPDQSSLIGSGRTCSLKAVTLKVSFNSGLLSSYAVYMCH